MTHALSRLECAGESPQRFNTARTTTTTPPPPLPPPPPPAAAAATTTTNGASVNPN